MCVCVCVCGGVHVPLLPTPGSGPVVCSSCGPVTTRCRTFFFLVLFVVLLLCYVDPV